MKSNRNYRREFTSYSFPFQADHNQLEDDDDLSLANLNIEFTNSLHNFSSNLNTFLRSRQRSTKPSITIPKDSNGNDLIINGSLFDGYLFQPTRSSYIIDYSNTPQDLNRFLEDHHSSSSTYSQLDPHLYKLVFIVTLSEWYVDKELLLGYYPHEDNDVNILEEISHYQRFCFPELNPSQPNGGQIFNDQSTYIFTRILSNGQVEYGYCRRVMTNYRQITKFPIVICIGND